MWSSGGGHESCLFSPHQLGFGIRGGIEAAVHAGRHFWHNISPGEALIKLDFSNAFNSVRRNCMLHSVLDTCPYIFPLVCSAYSSSSSLFWEDRVLLSAEGVLSSFVLLYISSLSPSSLLSVLLTSMTSLLVVQSPRYVRMFYLSRKLCLLDWF